MYRFTATVILLLTSYAWTQGTASAPAQLSNRPATQATVAPQIPNEPNIAPGTAVITLKNFCPVNDKAKAATHEKSCETVITRAQFEQVLNAFIPKARRPEGQIPAQYKRAIAQNYANMLMLAAEAEKRGYPEKDSETLERLKLSRYGVLSQALQQELQETAKPSDAEVEKYYKENTSSFEEATLQRVYIPKPQPGKDQPVDDATAKAAAEKWRQRAVGGEDLDALEKEAYAANTSNQNPPSTQFGARRRGTMAPDQEQQIFDLAAGGVTVLFDSPGGWSFYKVVSKRTLTFADATDDIARKLQQQKIKDANDAITGGVKPDFNDAYFGANQPAMSMPGMMMHPPAQPMSTAPARQVPAPAVKPNEPANPK